MTKQIGVCEEICIFVLNINEKQARLLWAPCLASPMGGKLFAPVFPLGHLVWGSPLVP